MYLSVFFDTVFDLITTLERTTQKHKRKNDRTHERATVGPGHEQVCADMAQRRRSHAERVCMRISAFVILLECDAVFLHVTRNKHVFVCSRKGQSLTYKSAHIIPSQLLHHV